MSNGAEATNDVLMRATGLGKRFALHVDNRQPARMGRLLREMAGGNAPLAPDRPEDFWALRDVSLELRRGEGLGVLGHNGAGKSTLIKLLMGRLKPTQGTVEIAGRVTAVTQLGVGFNPALSGRKNIFLNAAILGLTHHETSQLCDKIIDFAEIGQFIDQPIKTYSSGMLARLGYAVSAFLHPDVLLIDEVLAVGDLAFRRKCMRHIQKFREQGGALLFVSHDLYALQFVCDRALVLENGRLIFTGDVIEGTRRYLASIHVAENTESAQLEQAARGDAASLPTSETASNTSGAAPTGEPPLEASEQNAGNAIKVEPPSDRKGRPLSSEHPLRIDVIQIEPQATDRLQTGRPVRLWMHVRVEHALPPIRWGFAVTTADGSHNIATLVFEGLEIGAGAYELSAVIDELPLLAGQFQLRGGVADDQHGIPYDDYGYQDAPIWFSVWAPHDRLSGVRAVMGDLIRIDSTPNPPRPIHDNAT